MCLAVCWDIGYMLRVCFGYSSTVYSYVFLFCFFLMIRPPPRSTQSRSSAASDVYKRQGLLLAPGNARPKAPSAGRSKGRASLWERVVAPATVSYTHLRAQETVLDLVCRLLLEKKKYIEHCKERTNLPHAAHQLSKDKKNYIHIPLTSTA